MARKKRVLRTDLTPKQTIFVKEYHETGNPTYAATRAGYASPQVAGYLALQSVDVQKALAAKQEANVIAALAMPKATKGLIRRLDDPKTSNRDYGTLYARLETTASGLGVASDLDKAIQDMTPEEVAAAIARLEAQAMAKARDVTPGPSSAFD